MGRTKRIRNSKRQKADESKGLEPAFMTETIPLMKWMRKFKWKNTSKISCRIFEATGRGVSSGKNLFKGDALIAVPYELLITYSTISKSEEFTRIFKSKCKLGIHEMLAAFLVFEKHKEDQSFWKYYLKSLPTSLKLPWFSSKEETEYFPDELKKECEKCKTNFEASWVRLRCSMHTDMKCKCCEKKIEDILTLESYTWGYIMVNTRSIYVDPIVVRKFSNQVIIYDEPKIAMLPLMDMFNHSDIAENKIKFEETQEGLFYQLSILSNCKKNNQIFISYGRHDNIKLFTEYGFYLSRNSNNKIKFTWKEILNCINLELHNHQFAFLKKHNFFDPHELFISIIGPSFKLKGFLFVALYPQYQNYSMYVFSEDYHNRFMEYVKKIMGRLLDMKIAEYKFDYEKFKNRFECNKDICNFLEHRVRFVKYLNKVEDLFPISVGSD